MLCIAVILVSISPAAAYVVIPTNNTNHQLTDYNDNTVFPHIAADGIYYAYFSIPQPVDYNDEIYLTLQYYQAYESGVGGGASIQLVGNNTIQVGNAAIGYGNISYPSFAELYTDRYIEEIYYPIDYIRAQINMADVDENNYVEGLVFEVRSLNYTPDIIYPMNGTIINTSYPPLLSDITFSWYDVIDGIDYWQYDIARDANYNQLVYSATTTGNSTTKALDGDTYYFRIRGYETDVGYTDYAESTFTINSTSLSTGTGIEGVVYESTSSTQTPLEGAKVTAYNNESVTDSYDVLTSSNGYFYFDSEQVYEGTWFLIASKDGYETSSLNIVEVVEGNTSIKDIILEEENAPTYITPHYVRFIVTDTSYTRYSNATVTIYEGDSATALYTLTSGADGACGAELSETVEYRIVCEYEDQTVTFNIYPTDDVYRIYLDTSLLPDRDRLAIEEVQITITPSEINSTHANVYVNYVDNMSETTSLYLYVNNSDGGVLASGDIYPATSYNFTIPDYKGNDYNIIVKAEHGTFGSIVRQYSIHFNNTSLDIGIWGTWIAVVCILMVAMGSGKADADKAAGGILVLVFIFMAIGWLPHTLEFTTSYAVAFVVVVAWHMKNRDRSVAE